MCRSGRMAGGRSSIRWGSPQPGGGWCRSGRCSISRTGGGGGPPRRAWWWGSATTGGRCGPRSGARRPMQRAPTAPHLLRGTFLSPHPLLYCPTYLPFQPKTIKGRLVIYHHQMAVLATQGCPQADAMSADSSLPVERYIPRPPPPLPPPLLPSSSYLPNEGWIGLYDHQMAIWATCSCP